MISHDNITFEASVVLGLAPNFKVGWEAVVREVRGCVCNENDVDAG